MRARVSMGFACALAVTAGVVAVGRADDSGRARRVTWDDIAPLRDRLEAKGVTSDLFASYVARLRESNARRVREGDLDHLIFYLLQSTRFTTAPAIEPALSAKALVHGLEPSERETFVRSPATAAARISVPVRARITALLRALDSPDRDPRLSYFRSLVTTAFPDRRGREARLGGEYLRVMKFVYDKEFVAQRSGADAVAELYRTRGLSTDTAVEAGFLVYQGLGVASALEPGRRIRRALIVGPGLDLAPRTALVEAGPPASYQPWSVIDALLALGVSRAGELEVAAVDINLRVVEHLRGVRASPPTLTLVSEIRESDTVTLSKEYREYFARLGRAVGEEIGSTSAVEAGRLHKTVRVGAESARVLQAETLDIVTERLEAPAFDLVVATNILPYFDDVALMLAMSNIDAMLAPGGILLHNEARPVLHEIAAALGLPALQSRHAIVASVRGAPGPLVDSVWLHRKSGVGAHLRDPGRVGAYRRDLRLH